MADELRIWSIDGSSGEVVGVEHKRQTETERLLEDTIVKQPSMLMPGLTLVGRQTPTADGFLDLLGVGSDGRLIVFELKRGSLSREAVTQVIDYASDREGREFEELCKHITERSGSLGIDRIEDFEEWYVQHFEGQSPNPVRMALVGLGVDDNASRMVRFLAERGVEIDLITFHAFEHGGATLLARHVELAFSGSEEEATGGRNRKGEAEYRREIAERVQDWGIDFWEEALSQFKRIGTYSSVVPLASGFVFRLPKLSLPGHDWSFYACFAVRAVAIGTIRVTFLPIAIHLCQSQFEAASTTIPFTQERPPNAPDTHEVSQQWYCELDEVRWNEHKSKVLDLASSVYGAWDRARRGDFLLQDAD